MTFRRNLTLAAATVALGALAAGSAAAQQQRTDNTGLYVRGSLGYSWSFEDEIDYSVLYGAGIGYRFSPNMRVDLTADWRDRYVVEGGQGFILGGTPIDSQVDNEAYMFNVYYDIQNIPGLALPQGFRPYVGAGLGLSSISVDDTTVTVPTDDGVDEDIRDFLGDEDDQFAWQLMVGAAYNFTDKAFVDVGYRYADLGEAQLTSTAGTLDAELDVHEIVATIGYRF